MKLLKFDSYEEYQQIQREAYQRKLKKIWVTDKELRFIARFIQQHLPPVSFGLCHGVRNGYEVQKLRALLGVEVIGTDLGETAHQFPHVIQWDFHEIKEEWKGAVDFIYSNAWDHSYDPALMLRRWMSCLRPHGCCFLQWTRDHDVHAVREADCFGLAFDEMLDRISQDYEIEQVQEIPCWPMWGGSRRRARPDLGLDAQPANSHFRRLSVRACTSQLLNSVECGLA